MKLNPFIGHAKIRVIRFGEDEAKNTTAVWLSGAEVVEFESVPADIVVLVATFGLTGKDILVSAADDSRLPAMSALGRLISFCNNASFCDTSETLAEISSKLFVETGFTKTTFNCEV